MKRALYSFTFVILILTLLAQGCEVEEEYDITIINDTNFDFSVYLDDIHQFRLAAGGISTIKSVEAGNHSLDARDSDEIIAEWAIDVDQDIEWRVYVDTFEITVVNETSSYFSVFLDGVFQFELDPGYSRAILGVSEGEHTVDARIGGEYAVDVGVIFIHVSADGGRQDGAGQVGPTSAEGDDLAAL